MAQKELNITYKFKEPGQKPVVITDTKEIRDLVGQHRLDALVNISDLCDVLNRQFGLDEGSVSMNDNSEIL